MNTKPFIPSPSLLLSMIASAEAKFAADREQATLKAEAQADQRACRAFDAEVRARHYARIQRGAA
jgi:hypothetical protein